MIDRLVGKVVESAKRHRGLLIPAVVCLWILFAVKAVAGAVERIFSSVGRTADGKERPWRKRYGIFGPVLLLCLCVAAGGMAVDGFLSWPSTSVGNSSLTAREPAAQHKPVSASAITSSAITPPAITSAAITPLAITPAAITPPAVADSSVTVAGIDNKDKLPSDGKEPEKPDQSKPEEAKPNEAKPEEAKPAETQKPVDPEEAKQAELAKTVNKYVGMLKSNQVTPSWKPDLETESGTVYYTNAWMAYSQLSDEGRAKLGAGVEDYLQTAHKTMTGK